ncbi:MAG: saccharopine dehydrogenase family protein, partial [Caldilineaceae bacterium]
AGVTALIDTGTFPGIDNVLAADLLARRPDATELHLAFVCAGSGGGGFGVLQTTFRAVSKPYEELHGGHWVSVPSYSRRSVVDFGPPLGPRAVYPFEVPEIWSLARTFPQLRTVTSRFGTMPALWNRATQGLAAAPAFLRDDAEWLDLSARFMLPWVQRIDPLVGHALAVKVAVCGPGYVESSTYYAHSTTEAVGWATGAAAQLVLDGVIRTPGVLLPETHLPPEPYLAALTARGGQLTRRTVSSPAASS